MKDWALLSDFWSDRLMKRQKSTILLRLHGEPGPIFQGVMEEGSLLPVSFQSGLAAHSAGGGKYLTEHPM